MGKGQIFSNNSRAISGNTLPRDQGSSRLLQNAESHYPGMKGKKITAPPWHRIHCPYSACPDQAKTLPLPALQG